MGVERVSAHADLGFRMTRVSSYIDNMILLHVHVYKRLKLTFFRGKKQYIKVANSAEFYQEDGHV